MKPIKTKQKFKRSTAEEVKQMRELFLKGWSLNKIGRKFKKDHTTISYWIRNYNREGVKKKRDLPNILEGPDPELIKEEKRKQAEEIQRKINERIKSQFKICQNCGKRANDLKWSATHFCSSLCWHRAFEERSLKKSLEIFS